MPRKAEAPGRHAPASHGGCRANPTCSFWATKEHAPLSTLQIAAAEPADPDDLARCTHLTARTSGSYERPAWKRMIAKQIPVGGAAGPGPLEVQISFRASPERSWVTLWKPALDGLTPLLGSTDSVHEFHPRDDRIVRLGLHRLDDPSVGWDVELDIWWRRAAADVSPGGPNGPLLATTRDI